MATKTIDPITVFAEDFTVAFFFVAVVLVVVLVVFVVVLIVPVLLAQYFSLRSISSSHAPQFQRLIS